jgi:hypothetical protein
MPKLEWQRLESSGLEGKAYRCPLPGGWLVHVSPYGDYAGGLTFLPDPEHSWDGGSV